MERYNENYDTIDLIDMLKAIWHYAYIVVLFVAVTVSFVTVKTNYFTPDTYTASGIIYVSNKTEYERALAKNFSTSDIRATYMLGNTYIETLKTRSFLMKVSDSINNKYEWDEILTMLQMSIIPDTQLLTISVTASDPDDAYEISQSLLAMAPDKLEEVANGGSIRVVDTSLPPAANGKGLTANMIMAGFAGVELAVGFILIKTINDIKVRKGADMEKRYNISVLGEL